MPKYLNHSNIKRFAHKEMTPELLNVVNLKNYFMSIINFGFAPCDYYNLMCNSSCMQKSLSFTDLYNECHTFKIFIFILNFHSKDKELRV